jgi:hypothetical protein
MISDGAQPLSESDIDIIRKKHESKGLIMDTNTDIRWQLLAGRSATEDGNLLLSSAVPIIHVCAAFFNLVCDFLFESL